MPTFTVFKGSKDGVQKTTTTKPDQLSGDQVLLKVTASGLCGTDLHYVTLPGPGPGPGAIPGRAWLTSFSHRKTQTWCWATKASESSRPSGLTASC